MKDNIFLEKLEKLGWRRVGNFLAAYRDADLGMPINIEVLKDLEICIANGYITSEECKDRPGIYNWSLTMEGEEALEIAKKKYNELHGNR